jgi:hypothetical protein
MRSPPKRRFYQLEKFLKFIEDLRNIGCTGLHQAGHPGVVAWRIFPTLLVCTSGRFSPGWTITTAQGAWRLTAVAVRPRGH